MKRNTLEWVNEALATQPRPWHVIYGGIAVASFPTRPQAKACADQTRKDQVRLFGQSTTTVSVEYFR